MSRAVVALGESEPGGRSGRLWRALRSLSAEPQSPRESEGFVEGVSENLVLEFDEAYTAFVEGFERLPSEVQMTALQAVDAKLSSMVRARDAALWTERARREDAIWDEVRGLARRAIVAFDWPGPPS